MSGRTSNPIRTDVRSPGSSLISGTVTDNQGGDRSNSTRYPSTIDEGFLIRSSTPPLRAASSTTSPSATTTSGGRAVSLRGSAALPRSMGIRSAGTRSAGTGSGRTRSGGTESGRTRSSGVQRAGTRPCRIAVGGSAGTVGFAVGGSAGTVGLTSCRSTASSSSTGPSELHR